MSRIEAQSLSVKRAQVEFHKFASLGDFERVVQTYAEENLRRRGILLKHRDFIGPLSPFLEIGANAGHTSYMLANEFGADGFALDLSADALRYGAVLKDVWGLAADAGPPGGRRLAPALPGRFHPDGRGVSDAQPVHGYRERLPGSEARLGAGRHLLLRRGAAASGCSPCGCTGAITTRP